MTADPDTRASRGDGAKTQIQSVSRAVRLLVLVAERPDGATATEAAAALGIPVPTAYHLLNTLLAEGLLAKDPGRRYTLGPKVGVLSDAIARDLSAPSYLTGPLRSLAQETGETAYLTAWRRGEITVLACIEGARAVKVAGLYTGYYEHAHARATGKLLLAWADRERREEYLDSHPLVPVTDRTIVDRAMLEGELDQIRRSGFATDVEEFAEGVACVAVPVLEGQSLIAAYTISAPRERFDRRQRELTTSAQRAARAVSAHALSGALDRDGPAPRATASRPAARARRRRDGDPEST